MIRFALMYTVHTYRAAGSSSHQHGNIRMNEVECTVTTNQGILAQSSLLTYWLKVSSAPLVLSAC